MKYKKRKYRQMFSSRIIDIESMLKGNRNRFLLPTGSTHFNTILKGGFRPDMYLIFGANRTGKTQICHQMCLQAYIASSSSIYIDSENTFRPERIKQLCTTQGVDEEQVMKSILVAKVMSNSTLLLKLKEVDKKLKTSNAKLLIIDSINNHFRADQGAINISHNKLKNNFLSILQKLSDIAKKYEIILLATAQISPNFIEDPIIRENPVGLQYLNHFFSEYLYLIRDLNNNYIHIVNSKTLPENKLPFIITARGIEDYVKS
ncbi:MAG: ATPase domain-containing protein [Promethearchaeota archaeon]